MAWLRRHSILAEDRPTLEWDERAREWLTKVRAEQRKPLEALPREHPNYVGEFAGPSGLPYPSRPNFPLVARIVHASGPLPDDAPSAGLSERLKEKIEELEPGVHQFFPMHVIGRGGEIDTTRWSIVVCNRVDAIAPDYCIDLHEYRPLPEQYPDWYYYRSNEDNRMHLAVWREKIAGMAIWYDWRMQKFFLSEELGTFVMANKLRGYCLPADELRHTSHVEEV